MSYSQLPCTSFIHSFISSFFYQQWNCGCLCCIHESHTSCWGYSGNNVTHSLVLWSMQFVEKGQIRIYMRQALSFLDWFLFPFTWPRFLAGKDLALLGPRLRIVYCGSEIKALAQTTGIVGILGHGKYSGVTGMFCVSTVQYFPGIQLCSARLKPWRHPWPASWAELSQISSLWVWEIDYTQGDWTNY